MLGGLRVLDLTDPPGWLAGRILADLGADVVSVEPPDGHPALPYAAAAYHAGKHSITAGDAELAALVARADVVLETGVTDRYERLATPEVVWCAITSFGRTGPKSSWRASDLAVQAQSGVQWMTGDPDRAPIRCSAPTSWFHGCADAVAGVLSALLERDASDRGCIVDVSLQEAHVLATMSRVAQAAITGDPGRRAGALMRQGRSVQREIWRCADGHVTFALRGGPARIPGLKRLVTWMSEEDATTPALTERDWDAYSHTAITQDEIDAISEPIARFFATKTMTELFAAALERGLMLAPAYTAAEIAASPQLAARGFFTEVPDPVLGDVRLPRSFVRCDDVPGVAGPAARAPADGVTWDPREPRGGLALARLKVLEFGSGAAGPLASRYLADQGATVIRVESRARPDFLRLYALTPTQRSLDAAPMFAAFNANKRSVTLNMKHPESRDLAHRLVDWADVVVENFAPGAMARFGLAPEDLRRARPDLIVVSTCLNGQTGPERDYPGFGGQGSAISGFNHLTGWPDREPLGPYGTITDSLSPRFAAIGVLAALLRRARTGLGATLDVSQVEVAVYCLAPAIVEHAATGRAPGRLGNRSDTAAPHGAFRCRGEDRWVAVACWDDDDWRRLIELMGTPAWTEGFDTTEARLARVEELESHLEAWTARQDRDELAARLRDAGIEAAEVLDLAELASDPQLVHRAHFHPARHPVIGEMRMEALGFRLDGHAPAFWRAGPLLGQDNTEVYRTILGLTDPEIARLAEAGALD